MLLWGMAKKLWKAVKKYAVKIYKKLSAVKADFLKNMATREMLRNDKFTRSFLLRTAIAVFLMFFVCIASAAFDDYGSRVLILLICGAIILASYIYLSLGDFKALKRMNEHISAVKSGDYTPRNEEVGSPIYAATERINEISTSIQETVEKQVKSERMKIELVTNVSHDLKTPLTSIISYIDLLSDEELPPAARDYVTIIEEKSQRLKTMVADLFDLAKATSRTDVQSEEIDAVVLTRQVLGDLADKIEASGRQLKCDIQAETAPIYADGKKMYRVFQNVIDNALKYSMEGTRVYLTLKREMGRCEIVVKNIASYEMTFSPDEITERFTRGDESRSTEGNGLGLSIAKSFTEACGGEFKVEIDGDVFIAKISLAISN
jgi:signal transduction histidine kinase